MEPVVRSLARQRIAVVAGALAAVVAIVLLVGAGGSGRPAASHPGVASVPAASPASSSGPGTRPIAAASPTPAPTPHGPSQQFGMVAHLLWRDVGAGIAQLDAMVAAGLGVVRFDVSWATMEPEPGRYEGLDRLDALMGAIAGRGMRPIVTVIETPGWANGGHGRWTPPEDPGTYARFIGMLAERYAHGIPVAWEVWNEPNDPRFWQPAPDPAAYTRLLRAASEAVRTAAPASDVLGGSILYADTAFLQGMFDAGARGAFDGLAVHPYAGDRGPGDTADGYHSFVATLDRLHAVLARNGTDVQLWITETGWPLDAAVDDAHRGEHLAAAVDLVRSRSDIAVMAVYVMDRADDAVYGLTADGRAGASFSRYAAAVASGSP